MYRWLSVVVGLSLLIPGIIHLIAFEDTVAASFVFGPFAFVAALGAVVFLIGSGIGLLIQKFVRLSCTLGIIFLVFGSYVHVMWAVDLSNRADTMPEGLSDADQALYLDTISYAASAQVVHFLKNIVLIALLVAFYIERTALKK